MAIAVVRKRYILMFDMLDANEAHFVMLLRAVE
jgi:hypothetical protein